MLSSSSNGDFDVEMNAIEGDDQTSQTRVIW